MGRPYTTIYEIPHQQFSEFRSAVSDLKGEPVFDEASLGVFCGRLGFADWRCEIGSYYVEDDEFYEDLASTDRWEADWKICGFFRSALLAGCRESEARAGIAEAFQLDLDHLALLREILKTDGPEDGLEKLDALFFSKSGEGWTTGHLVFDQDGSRPLKSDFDYWPLGYDDSADEALLAPSEIPGLLELVPFLEKWKRRVIDGFPPGEDPPYYGGSELVNDIGELTEFLNVPHHTFGYLYTNAPGT